MQFMLQPLEVPAELVLWIWIKILILQVSPVFYFWVFQETGEETIVFVSLRSASGESGTDTRGWVWKEEEEEEESQTMWPVVLLYDRAGKSFSSDATMKTQNKPGERKFQLLNASLRYSASVRFNTETSPVDLKKNQVWNESFTFVFTF